MNKFLSPEELWQSYDITGSLDVETLQTDEFGDYVYQQVMFSGQKYQDGTCKIFGVLAYGKNMTFPAPCVLLVHDFGGRIDFSYIDYFLHLGVAVFMCDYSGIREGERHTIFPDSKQHMNHIYNTDPDITRGVDNSVWIGDTLIFRHALKFLKSQPHIDTKNIGVVSFGLGSIIGFHLASCEPDLKFCCNFHYGGWRDFENISKELDSDMARYLLVVAPQVYSPIAKVPLFLLGSTNTTTGDCDKIFDTFARCNGSISNLIYLSPNYISTVDHLATQNLQIIIKEYLQGKTISQPPTPHIDCSTVLDDLLVLCEVEQEYKAKSVKLYYCQGDNPPHLRSYQCVEMVLRSDGKYVGNLSLSSSLKVVLFANVEYENGYTITSNQLKVAPFGSVSKTHSVITLGKTDSFFPLGTLNFPKANQFFCDKNLTVSEKSALDIYGVSAPRLATFALSDPTLEKTDKTILLQVCCDLPQQIRLMLSVGDSHEANFSAQINLLGGDFWQKIMLSPQDFSSADMATLDSFEECHLLFFTSEYDFYISNMSMI